MEDGDSAYSETDTAVESLLEKSPWKVEKTGLSNWPSFTWLRCLTVLFGILCIIQAVIIAILCEGAQKGKAQLTYSPAKDAVQYEVKTFKSGYLDDQSIYQSHGQVPTDETDQAWSDLYQHWSYSRISRQQAARLTNLTVPIPEDPDYYIIGLDVFHQIHCLDNLRKALWPERYKPQDNMGGQGMSLMSRKHLDHCVDQLRQSLMCNADISTIWLRWDPEVQKSRAVVASTHTCKNFEQIHRWADQHRLVTWNDSIFVDDPLKKNR